MVVKLDANGIPCGKGWISKEKECRVSTPGGVRGLDKSKAVKGVVAGVATAGVIAGGAHVASVVSKGKGKISRSDLSVASKEKIASLRKAKDAPELKPGFTSKAEFVEDAQGNSYVFKQVINPMFMFQGASDVIASDMAKEAGIKMNDVEIVPWNAKSEFKTVPNVGATLHSAVKGKNLHKTGSSEFEGMRFVQKAGLKDHHIRNMAKHPDLPRIVALDTFVGNRDRSRSNLFYDEKDNSFTGIDLGDAYRQVPFFEASLPKMARKTVKSLDVSKLSPQEVAGLSSYLDTLRELRDNNPPEKIVQRYQNYLRLEGGGLDVGRKYLSYQNIFENARSTDSLIQELEKKLNARVDSKGIPCGKGWISAEKECLIGVGAVAGGSVLLGGVAVAGASLYFLDKKKALVSDIETDPSLLTPALRERRKWYDEQLGQVAKDAKDLGDIEEQAKATHGRDKTQENWNRHKSAYLDVRAKADDAFNLHFNRLADGFDVRHPDKRPKTDNRGKKVFIARHAEREDYATPGYKPPRPGDNSLSENGILQAREMAKSLRGQGITEVYSSPFLRTLQTANEISKELGVPIKLEPGMAEWHNGNWHSSPLKMMSPEEAKRLFPSVDLNYQSPHRPKFPENSDDVLQRSRNVAHDIATKSIGNPVLIGHGPTVIGASRALSGDSSVVLPQFAAVSTLEGTESGWKSKGLWHPIETKKPKGHTGRMDSLRLDKRQGIPCGKGWISADYECRTGGGNRVSSPVGINPINDKLIKQAALGGGLVGVGAVVGVAVVSNQQTSRQKEKEKDTQRFIEQRTKIYAHFSNRPDLAKKFTLEADPKAQRGKGKWKPEMSPEEAEDWSKGSAYPEPVYHLTSHWAAGKIKEGGFIVPKKAAVGRDRGNGVYLGTGENAKTQLTNFYGGIVGAGSNETLEVRTNLKKVLNLQAVLDEAREQGFNLKDSSEKGGLFGRGRKKGSGLLEGIENPSSKYGGVDLQLMRITAATLGKNNEFEDLLEKEKKKGSEAPEGVAFGTILQEMGYDGLHSADTQSNAIDMGKRHPGILLSFDPKAITVVKEKGDISFSKTPSTDRSEVNGKELKTTPIRDFSKIATKLPFKEPDFDYPVSGANRKSGVTVVEPDGRIWMMKVKGEYGGEKHSNPRGGSEEGLTDWQNAMKEAKEELGLDVQIVDFLGDFDHYTGKKANKGSKAVTRQYIGVRTGGAPWQAHYEAELVQLLSLPSAKTLVQDNSRGDQIAITDQMQSYLSPANLRKLERAFQEQRSDAEGIPCGKGWISAEKECQISGKSVAIAGGGLIAAGVIAGIAVNARTSKSHTESAIQNGLILANRNSDEYIKLRESYRSNFKNSAKEASDLSKKIEVQEIGQDKKQITFPISGFYHSNTTRAEDVFGYELGKILGDDHAVVPYRNTEYNKSDGIKMSDPGYALNKMLVDGKNKESVKLAATVLAYKEKYPEKKVNLIAHSGGGLIVDEANHLISMNNQSNRTINLGTLWFGVTDAIGDYKGIVDREDPKLIPDIPGSYARSKNTANSYPPKSKMLKIEKNNGGDQDRHSLKHYIKSPEIRAEIFDTLNKERWDSLTLDAEGIPCGKGWISAEKECRVKSPTSSKINPAITVGAGVGLLAGGAIATQIGYTVSRGKGGSFPINTVSQEEVSRLKVTREIAAGKTGNTFMVSDGQKTSVLKETTDWKALPFLQQSSDVIGAEIGIKAGINVNKVRMIPKGVEHPKLEGKYGATLHDLVPGEPATESSVTDRFGDVTLSQFDGLTPIGVGKKHIERMAKHEDLAKIAALDTYIGNWDRNSANLFYDKASDSFHGIDMGVAHSHIAPVTRSLAKATSKGLKDLDFKSLPPEQIKGMETYLDTLKTLHKQNSPREISQRYQQYISAQGGDWNLFKKYVSNASAYSNHSDTGKLIKEIESKMALRQDSQLPKDLYVAVKNSIQSAYGDFSGFPIIYKDTFSPTGSITGVFRDGTELFDYEITSDNLLSYVESSRSDSYLVGFSVDSGLISHFRNDAAKSKKQCKEGKPCGNTCVAKGYKCRVRLGVRQRSALTQVRLALQGNPVTAKAQNVLTNPKYQKGLAIAGVTAVTGAAVLGGAATIIQNDLKRSSVSFDSIRQPPNGVPDEQTLAKYDTFVPGQLIRKNFTDEEGLGTRQHYGVYVGKNKDSGEHMVIDTGKDYRSRDDVPFVQMRGLTWGAGKRDSEWEVVPEDEMYQTKNAKKLSQEEVLDRANKMLYQRFRYEGFDSNCEAFARGIVEGDAYSAQGMKTTPLTRFVSRAVTDNALKVRGNLIAEIQQYKGELEQLEKQGQGESDRANELRGTIGSFTKKAEVWGITPENTKDVVSLPIKVQGVDLRITGLSEYGKDEYKMNAQQMVEYLKREKIMAERRKWEDKPNAYTGEVNEGATKGKITPPRNIATIADELNISIDPNYKTPAQVEEARKKLEESFKLPAAKRDADEVELMSTEAVDFFLNSLGLRTPKQLEEAIDAVASEFPLLKKAIAQQIISDYLLTLFAVLTQDN